MLLNSEGSIDLGEVIDTNHDGKIEVWSWGSNGLVTRQALGDLNQDGVVDKKDVQKMITKLTGKPVKEQIGEKTTTTVTEITTTDVTTTNTTICTLYGPPHGCSDTETEAMTTTTTDVTAEIPQPAFPAA